MDAGFAVWQRLNAEPCRFCGTGPAEGVSVFRGVATSCCAICRELLEEDEEDPPELAARDGEAGLAERGAVEGEPGAPAAELAAPEARGVDRMAIGFLIDSPSETDLFGARYALRLKRTRWSKDRAKRWQYYKGWRDNMRGVEEYERSRGFHLRPNHDLAGERHRDNEIAMLLALACGYCGKPGPSGLDRLNNDKGYVRGNLIPACGDCNMLKGVMSLDRFLTARAAVAASLVADPVELFGSRRLDHVGYLAWAQRGVRYTMEHPILAY